MIQILPKERWDELAEIFYREFEGSYLPHRERSTIIADVDDETNEIRGFIVSEVLVRIGQIYRTGDSLREMFGLLETSMPTDVGVIVIADQPRYEMLAQNYDMREIPGKIYRRDL